MLPFRFAHARRMRPLCRARCDAFIQRLGHHLVFPILVKQLRQLRLSWLIGKAAAGAHRAGGQGLPLNLTLGAPPIGRSDSRNRSEAGVPVQKFRKACARNQGLLRKDAASPPRTAYERRS